MKKFDGGVTVLMPVYNSAKFAGDAIRSVLAQTYSDFEFIIIDDGSKDNSADVIKKFKDSRIRFVRRKHAGLAPALNYGMGIAQNEWIARIDSDDLAVPGRLAIQSEFLASNPGVTVIAGHSAYFSGDADVKFIFRPPESDEEIKKMLNMHNPVNHSTVTFRKTAVKDAGGYDETMECFEDFELWLRLRDELTFAVIPEVLAFTRLRKDSMTSEASTAGMLKILKKNCEYERQLATRDESAYWDEVLFRIEYFYGDRKSARKKIPGIKSMKHAVAFLSTFLPEKGFRRLKDSRLRYRLNTGTKEKKLMESKLNQIITKNGRED